MKVLNTHLTNHMSETRIETAILTKKGSIIDDKRVTSDKITTF